MTHQLEEGPPHIIHAHLLGVTLNGDAHESVHQLLKRYESVDHECGYGRDVLRERKGGESGRGEGEDRWRRRDGGGRGQR